MKNKKFYIDEIIKLKKQKNAILLAHYYVDGDIQDIADFVGDSLILAKKAAETNADIIVFAGVHFMAETAKILSPNKKVIIPDISSGCPLADSMPAEKLKHLKEKYPDHFVISYINTTAEVKALSDIICTSSNAVDIVNSLPEDVKIIFGPDKNLGAYVKGITGRDMIIWEGYCPVHQNFDVKAIDTLKKQYADAIVLAHPEAGKEVLLKANYIGSTSKIIKAAVESSAKNLIIATEPGVIHQIKKLAPEKNCIPLPTIDKKPQSLCVNMKKHNLKKVYNALLNEKDEIIMDEDLIAKARKPIERMLNLSVKLGLIKN